MLSDNGTNFVSASRKLRDLVSGVNQDKIQRMTSNKGVSWKWKPPVAPHFGGVFAVLGDAEVNDKELGTIFIGVESLLRSRPLTAVSDDTNDDRVLTPNNFLIGKIGADFVPESVDTVPFNPKKRWRRLQELTRHVWNRWMIEYLPQIGSREKWYFRNDNLQVVDVVVGIDPGTVRRQWNVGLIEQTYSGPDGLVRVVVRVNGKTLK